MSAADKKTVEKPRTEGLKSGDAVRFSLKSAAPVLVAIGHLCSGLICVAQGIPAAPPAPEGVRLPGPGRPVVKSPEFAPDGSVTFHLFAPQAGAVAVSLDWQDRTAAPVPMTKDPDGLWKTTVSGVPMELRTYNFVLDGLRIPDPANPYQMRDGNRFLSALRVPSERTTLAILTDVPHGEVHEVWYASPTLGLKQRRMTVYTPPGYEDTTRRYPVLYLLHGGGGDEEAWKDMGHAIQILDNLIAAGKAAPMIVAMPNGNYTQIGAPGVVDQVPAASPLGASASPVSASALGKMQMKFAPSVVPDIVPYIDKHYRTFADRNHRAIAGLSMGGAHTALVGLNNIDLFSYVGLFSAAYPLLPGALKVVPIPADTTLRGPGIGQELELSGLDADFPKLNAASAARLQLLYISCGEADTLIKSNLQFVDWLKGKNVHYEKMTLPRYVHEWAFWRISLADFSQKIFK